MLQLCYDKRNNFKNIKDGVFSRVNRTFEAILLFFNTTMFDFSLNHEISHKLLNVF